MDIRIVLVFALVALVTSHDVTTGLNSGNKVFDEKREASPALWRQVQNVTISTNDSEVINGIVITDLRPDKDGDAKIVDGGEGQNNVTIELKSPTVLRGYDFRIEVYAVPEQGYVKNTVNGNRDVNHPSLVGQDDFNKKPGQPNFEQTKPNFDGTTKLPESTRRVRNPEKVTPKVFDNSTPLNPTDLAHENATLTVVKGLQNSTTNPNPSTVVAGHQNTQATNTKGNQNRDEGEIPHILTGNLPPNTKRDRSESATNFPVTMDRDLKINEQERRVRGTEDGDQKLAGHPSNAGTNTPATVTTDKPNEAKVLGNRHEHDSQDGLDVLPLNPKGIQDASIDEVDGRQLENYGGNSYVPVHFGKGIKNDSSLRNNEETSVVNTHNDRKVQDHHHNNQGNNKHFEHDKFPMIAMNVDTTKLSTEKPRNARETEGQNTKNVPRPFVYQRQDNPSTTARNVGDSTTLFGSDTHDDKNVLPTRFDSISNDRKNGAPFQSTPRNTEARASIATVKAQGKESEESYEDYTQKVFIKQ